MIKTNLQVLILKDFVLLPHCELRLDIKNDIEKNMISTSLEDDDGHILVINNSKDKIDIKQLPKIGIITKIKSKIVLPNGNIRISLLGKRRVKVIKYNKQTDGNFYKANIEKLELEQVDINTEEAYKRKIYSSFKNLLTKTTYIDMSILKHLDNVNDLSMLIDIICQILPLSIERKEEYVLEVNIVDRANMLIKDIRRELELLNIEINIESNIQKDMENVQKEYLLKEKLKNIQEELDELSDKKDDINDISKYKKRLSIINPPKHIYNRIIEEINKFSSMTMASPEYSITKAYIETLLSLPYNIFSKENDNLNKAKQILDSSHYGLLEVKDRILEYLAVKIKTKNAKTPIICLSGPPGVGKTTLSKSIARAMGRKFAKISVGGTSDEADIVGHRRTYIGAYPGKIITAIKKTGTNNPLILIDEIDKLGKDIHGDPASVLLEILDKNQNKNFIDNYIDIEYDLSNVIFILTANYVNQIPEPLRDRLEIIEISSYTEYEKMDIAKKYLVPKLIKENGINKKNIMFNDKAILEIIKYYTKESGVRELNRCLEKIIRKVVKLIVTENVDDILYNIYDTSIVKYLGNRKYFYSELSYDKIPGIVNGLAYTECGGDVLPIEVIYYKGKGNITLTGSLGDVIKESASIALSYIKQNYKLFGISYSMLENSDIHIHMPEGAIPKDGPSAGIALTTAIISSLTKKEVNQVFAMTGEITLTGKVLAIGGLKEKILGAKRSGIKKIIIPESNRKDLEEMPKYIKNKLEFYYVKKYNEVYEIIFKKNERK